MHNIKAMIILNFNLARLTLTRVRGFKPISLGKRGHNVLFKYKRNRT